MKTRPHRQRSQSAPTHRRFARIATHGRRTGAVRTVATRLGIETLESRMLLSISPGQPSVDFVACGIHDYDGSQLVADHGRKDRGDSSRIPSL